MVRKRLFVASAAMIIALIASSDAQAWGGYHVGYTHYSPSTGLHHYGYTRAYGGGYGGAHYGGGYGGYHYGGGGYGGYHYGGYHYGGYGGYGGAHYGYYRRY